MGLAPWRVTMQLAAVFGGAAIPHLPAGGWPPRSSWDEKRGGVCSDRGSQPCPERMPSPRSEPLLALQPPGDPILNTS